MKLHKWRRRQMIRMKSEDPARTATSIAEELQVSVSRVTEVLKQEGLYVSPWTSFNCSYCGEPNKILKSAEAQKRRRGNKELYCDRKCYDIDRKAYPYK